MSVFWNSRVRTLVPYVPGEQPRDRQFIKLNTNENPYPPALAVIEAVHAAATERLRLYPDPSCTEFRKAAAAACDVAQNQVFAGNGSDEILAFAFAAFFEQAPAPPVLFPDITYSFYPVYAALWGIPFREVPLTADWSLNRADYLVPSGGIIFPNPNAPTGCAIPREDIIAFAEYAAQNNSVVIVDEAYSAFSTTSILPLPSGAKNILCVRTLSKAYSLAGLRAGFAVGDPALITALERIRDSFNSYTLDSIAQAAARAALNESGYYSETCARVVATRERVSSRLRALGFTVLKSSANFIFIRHPHLSGSAFFMLLRENGILVRHFAKERINEYVRVSIGTDSDMDIFLNVCTAGIG
ncbi:MAG: histidinol-phosphate transaminase [Spirochaetaceae bacterium]|jgi:histidinol-phosphate aminotransferase|nr:histidinol-phosphate transaminase [Spirochaetaceae bacterium]